MVTNYEVSMSIRIQVKTIALTGGSKSGGLNEVLRHDYKM
jgi:hypothetical protein